MAQRQGAIHYKKQAHLTRKAAKYKPKLLPSPGKTRAGAPC